MRKSIAIPALVAAIATAAVGAAFVHPPMSLPRKTSAAR